jgi:hypothetical protein
MKARPSGGVRLDHQVVIDVHRVDFDDDIIAGGGTTNHKGHAVLRGNRRMPCVKMFRRTANTIFAVRFPKDARQTITHGLHILCRAFLE